MNALSLIQEDVTLIVEGMEARNPILKECIGNGLLSLDEFALAVIIQWKTMNRIAYPDTFMIIYGQD